MSLPRREGLWRLLELSRKPIFIIFESQYREIAHPAISLLRQHRGSVTLLVWRAGSMVRAEQTLSRWHPLSIPGTPFPSQHPHFHPSTPGCVSLPAMRWGCSSCSYKAGWGTCL